MPSARLLGALLGMNLEVLYLYAGKWYTAAMKPHILQSRKTPELFGFTVDETGENLPSEDGPWETAGNAIPLGITMASTSPKIGQEIERKGYALVKGRSVSQPHLHGGDSKQ
jgi:hypothetical protein